MQLLTIYLFHLKYKELKEKELKMKNYQQQMRKEDFMANSLRVWNTEILPNWNEQ